MAVPPFGRQYRGIVRARSGGEQTPRGLGISVSAVVSALRRLLDELSWEGNARKYRDGGLGLENVLTTEVFQGLDFLPRQAFLGRVLATTSGARPDAAVHEVEEAAVDVLPGDLTHPLVGIRAQPDVRIDSPGAFVFVEAKRPRSSTFGSDQLAKELILTVEHARGRRPTLLLVLGTPPPVRVRGHGLFSIEDAVQLGQESLAMKRQRPVDVPDPTEIVAWTTWADIAAHVDAALHDFPTGDSSILNAVTRVGGAIADAVIAHSQ